MMFTCRLLLLLLAVPVFSQAQDFNHYKPIKASGKIPADFVRDMQQKVLEGANIVEGSKGWEKRVRKDFVNTNTYFLGQMLSSGRVLFGDPISAYTNKVKDILLADHPELKNIIRVYTLRTTEVNAFANNDGILFVTTGLISQLESEAQLAFILSHEIVHYANKHNLTSYITKNAVLKGKKEYSKFSFKEKLLASHSYSRELETESDVQGLTRFYESSPYSYESLPGVFDVLQFSYLPYDDRPFNYALLENNNMFVPKEYRLKKINEIAIDEDYDDSMHTHPNVSKRRKEIMAQVEGKSNEGRRNFVQDRNAFYNIRKISRFEMVRTHIVDSEFAEAIYLINLLKEDSPESYYLDRGLVSALYGAAKMKTHKISIASLSETSKIQGHSMAVYNLLRKLNGEQLTILALDRAWRMRARFPDDRYLNKVVDDLMSDLVYIHEVDLEEFHTSPKSELMAELGLTEELVAEKETKEVAGANIFGEDVSEDTESETEVADNDAMKGMSKAEKIRLKKRIRNITSERKFMYFAFVDALKDKAFTDRYLALQKARNEAQKAEDAKSYEVKRKEQKEARKEKLRLLRKGHYLGDDALMVLEPLYVRKDNRKGRIDYESSDHYRKALTQNLAQKSAELGLNTQIFNLKDLSDKNLDDFNEAVLMKEWARERMEFESVPVVSSQMEEIEAVGNKYKADKLLIPGVISTRYGKHAGLVIYKVFAYSMTVFLLPLAVYEIARKVYVSEYYYLLFDINTGEVIMPGYKRNKSKDYLSSSRSVFNKVLVQVKRKKS